MCRFGGAARCGPAGPEGAGVVAGEPHLAGALAEGCLDAVAPPGDDLPLSASGHAGPAGSGQLFGDLASVERGGHDAPGADDAAAQLGPDGQPEAAGPWDVRGVTAGPAGHVVARAGPAVPPGPAVSPPGSAEVSICRHSCSGRRAGFGAAAAGTGTPSRDLGQEPGLAAPAQLPGFASAGTGRCGLMTRGVPPPSGHNRPAARPV